MNRRADFLVIGSGIAGLRAAVALAEAGDVLLLTKADPTESNTGYAQGGIAAATGADDHPDLHYADTLAAGDGLCVDEAVRVLVDEGPRYVEELISWGARFDRDGQGRIARAREAAHAVRRVLHAADATGREIGRTLQARALRAPRLTVLNDAQAAELLVDAGRCLGARYVSSITGQRRSGEIRAAATLLATGGAGQVFSETTNPAAATGDGVCLAWRAGARVTDMEFVQFHPTALAVAGAPRLLLSEALRGEGARLVNSADEAFMTRYEPGGDLAARDRVSRAILRETRRTGAPVHLSLRHLDPAVVQARFPGAAAACRSVGLDLARDRIPVGPAAHYVMGGVETDLWGRTTIPALFAAGEVACTGVHGANRLASNSLLEGLVFGARAARAMTEPPAAGRLAGVVREVDSLRPSRLPKDRSAVRPGEQEIRRLMWEAVGLERHEYALRQAVQALARWQAAVDDPERPPSSPAERRLTSLVTVGRLMAAAALRRTESRGGHFRGDFPARDDVHWSAHIAERSRDTHL